MLLSMALSVSASGFASINAVIEVDAENKIIRISGTASGEGSYVSIYLLRPGKDISDIKKITNISETVSYIGQASKIANGIFSDEFRYSGDAGVYTLCLKNGGAYREFSVDTTASSSGVQLYDLKNLPNSFAPIDAETTEKKFEFVKNELGSEMPIVKSKKPTGSREVFVAPLASTDAPDGSIDNPYTTVSEAIASLGADCSDAIVYLRGGVYPQKSFGKLKNINSTDAAPLYIGAYNGEKVTVVGGEVISKSAFGKVMGDEKAMRKIEPTVIDNILSVNLKGLGITDYGEFTVSNRPVLSVGDDNYEIARWPDSSQTTMRRYDGDDGENGVVDSGPITTGVGSTAGAYREFGKAGEKGFEVSVDDVRPFSWEDTGNIWMHGSFYREWTKNHVKIKSFNSAKRSVRTYSGLSWGAEYNENNGFYYYNVMEELTAPGEWFLDDETGKLYIYPINGSIDDATLSAHNSEIMSVKNCSNIVIDGIIFEKSMNSAVTVSDSEGIVYQNCVMDSCGGNGVNIDGTSKYCGVINSKIMNCDGDAFYINMSAQIRNSMIPQRNFLQNSYVYNCNPVRTNGVGNIVSHNVVSNSVGTALYILGGCENVYEYNEVYASPREIEDAAGIYVNGNNYATRGNHVRYNYIHDTDGERESNFNGIYLDDMLSGCYIYGNILEKSIIFIHGGSENAVVNNIIVNPIKASSSGTVATEGIKDSVNYVSNDTRWVSGALKKGSFTSYLKYDYYTSDVWKNRYKSLYDFSELMKMRIAEYEQNLKILSDINVRYADGEIEDGNVVYGTDERPSDNEGRFDTSGAVTDLDTYLRMPKYNFIKSNMSVNALNNCVYIYNISKRTSVEEDNYNLAAGDNPFGGLSYSDKSAYDAVRNYISGFENINFDFVGIICGSGGWSDYVSAEKPIAVTPIGSVDAAAIDGGVDFKWHSKFGAGVNRLQISQDVDFSDLVCEKTTYNTHCAIPKDLFKGNTVYYWRVVSENISDNVKGTQITSDAEEFVITNYATPVSVRRNSVVVRDLKIVKNSDETVAGAIICNSSAESINGRVFVAFYCGGSLVDIKFFDERLAANDFSEKISFATDKNADSVKYFVWSADNSCTPIARCLEKSIE